MMKKDPALEYVQVNRWNRGTETVTTSDDMRPNKLDLEIRQEALKIHLGEVERMHRAVVHMMENECDMGFKSDYGQVVHRMDILMHNLKVEINQVKNQLEGLSLD